MSDLIPAPRPVESREQRMRAATANDHLDTANRREYPTSFATYLDAHERDQLDARAATAATAEQERDDALDDLQDARADLKHKNDVLQATATALGMLGGDRIDDTPAVAARLRAERDEALDATRRSGCGHTTQQHHTLDGLEADLRNAERENTELRAENTRLRDTMRADVAAMRADLNRMYSADMAKLRAQRDEALDRLDGDAWERITADNARLRAELADAQELIAELRNNRERDDRALARYDTRQAEARGQYELDHPGEVIAASPAVLAAVANLAADLGSPAARAQDQETQP